MPVLLVRIDDRLIHGQVSIGWAGRLKPDLILVLDDEAAADSWEGDLVCSACPESVTARVFGIEEGAARLASGAFGDKKLLILLRSARSAVRLVESGCPVREINLGGLHHHAGTRSYLPYVYLDESEVRDLVTLMNRGVRVTAQDIPGNKAHDMADILPGGEC